MELRVGRCGTYQAELGLQLDLEGLEGPLQLVDLRPGGLKTLCARRHLLVQLVKLEDTERLMWDLLSRGRSRTSSQALHHLPLVPVFHIATVLIGDGLILSSDICHDGAHVSLRLSIHLHVHRAAAHLVAQGRELLKAEGAGDKA